MGSAPSPGPSSGLPGTADVSVRPARPGEGGEVARVQAVAWRTAYRSVLPTAVLDDWDAEAAAQAWEAAVVAPPTRGHGVLVAVERDTVVGFAAYGPAEVVQDEAPSLDGPTAEVATLLVEPRWGRRGHGSRLLAAVADLAESGGARRLQAWLLEPDRVSARFFESAGWAPDGWARMLETGGEPLREIRWHALLGEGAGEVGS